MQFRTRQVDSFVRTQLSADYDARVNIRRNNPFDLQLDIPIREKNRMACLDFVREAFQGYGYPMLVARNRFRCQYELLPGLQLNKSVFNEAYRSEERRVGKECRS